MIVAAFAVPIPKLTMVKPSSLVADCIGRFSPRISQSNLAANRST